MALFGGKRASMKRWVASKAALISQIPRPTDFPQVHSDGPDADRVLVFGTGIAAGWGATSHADALPGRLARSISDLTTRGTDVDVLSYAELALADARNELFGAKLWRFDIIVVSLGDTDALRLTEPELWRQNLTVFLDELTRAAGEHTRIELLGIAPVGSIAVYSGSNAALADAHARLLDAVSAEIVAAFPRVNFLDLSADHTDYQALSEELADASLDDLNAARVQARDRPRGPAGQNALEREEERIAAVQSMRILDTAHDPRFDHIVTMARQLYGTSGAAFAVVDRERVWHKSATEGVPSEVPKDASFCSTTILLRGPHIVPDMLLENAPSDTSAADAVGVRFYAGYPVESPSGEQIGALCVFDEKPRELKDVDETMLRQLALLIQAELQVDALERR